LVIILVDSGVSRADVCFSDEEAGQIEYEVKKGRACSGMLDTLTQIKVEQAGQIESMKGAHEACRADLEYCAQVMKEKDKVVDDMGEAAKGSFWSRLKSNLTIFGAGSLAGIVLIGLLVLL